MSSCRWTTSGTNWSSFEPFKRHAISTVKIDGSFVAGLESNQGINRLVVETVIHMAHSLGMSAIVEQVENVNQLRIASSFGADAAQGFFFARPIPRADARSFAEGPEIPVFSRTEAQTLLLAEGGTAPLVDVPDRRGTGDRDCRTSAGDVRSRPGPRAWDSPTRRLIRYRSAGEGPPAAQAAA